jgi:hypothetical protein
MNQGIIDNVVSKEAFDQVQKLESMLESVGAKMSSIGVRLPRSKESDQLISALKKIEELENKIAARTDQRIQKELNLDRQIKERKVSLDALTRAEREQIKATNEVVGSYQNLVSSYNIAKKEMLDMAASGDTTSAKYQEAKLRVQELDAQIKSLNASTRGTVQAKQNEVGAYAQLVQAYNLARKEMLDMAAAGDLTSKKFLDAKANATKLGTDLFKLNASTIQVGSGMNNAYNSTFQMTQVMRELPNFAMGARIGFMSLSNNLPMLYDGFAQLAKQIDSVTGKEKGWGYAFKTMGKSLLSMNTVLILATTLLVLFGDDLVKLIGKLSAAEQANNEFIASLKKGNEEYMAAVENIAKVESAFDGYKNGVLTASQALEIYNKELGDTFGSQEDLNAAIEDVTNKKDGYLDAMLSMALANKQLELASKNASKAVGLRAQDEVKWYQKISNSVILFGKLMVSLGKGNLAEAMKYSLEITSIEDSIISNREARAKKAEIEAREQLEEYEKTMNEYYRILKENGLKIGDEYKNRERIAREIITREQAYSEIRGRIVEELTELELKKSREMADGQVNSYLTRMRAAEEFYTNSIALAKADYEVAKRNADEKLRVDRKRIDKTLEGNKKLYEQGKLSLEEYEKAQRNHSENIEILENNHRWAMIKAQDEYNKTIKELEIERISDIRSATLDGYKDIIQDLDIQLKEQQALMDKHYKELENKYSEKNMLDIFFGEDNAIKILTLQQEYERESLNLQKAFVEHKLSMYKEGTQEYIDTQAELNSIIIEEERLSAEQRIELENEVQNRKKDLQKGIAENTKDALKEVWESYFEWYDKQLDKELEKQERVKDKRLEVIQSQYDSSLMTQEEYEAQKEAIELESEKREQEIEKRREEAERRKFFLEQAMALAKVWINAALKISSPTNVYGVLTPMYLAEAVAATALIAAQSIPYFEEGGEMKETGLAVVGEKRKEVVLTPRGEVYITPDTPTLVHLERGSTVFPDASNLNNEAIAKMVMVNAGLNFSTKTLEKKLDKLIAIEEGKTFQLPKERLMDKLIFARKL